MTTTVTIQSVIDQIEDTQAREMAQVCYTSDPLLKHLPVIVLAPYAFAYKDGWGTLSHLHHIIGDAEVKSENTTPALVNQAVASKAKQINREILRQLVAGSSTSPQFSVSAVQNSEESDGFESLFTHQANARVISFDQAPTLEQLDEILYGAPLQMSKQHTDGKPVGFIIASFPTLRRIFGQSEIKIDGHTHVEYNNVVVVGNSYVPDNVVYISRLDTGIALLVPDPTCQPVVKYAPIGHPEEDDSYEIYRCRTTIGTALIDAFSIVKIEFP